MGAYLTALQAMPLCLQSMEVMNKMTELMPLPQEVMAQYVTYAMQQCSACKDKFLQARLVRLVCVFLSSLIHNGRLRIAALRYEI